MDDVGLVQSVLDLTCFDIVDCLGNIHRDGTGLGVRHKAFRSEDTAETTDNAHHIRCGNDYVEIKPAVVLDTGKELLAADVISACCLCLIQLRTLCEYEHANLLAGAGGKDYCATDLLICMTSVAACTDVDLNSLIKFCSCGLLDKRNGFFRFINGCAVDKFRRFSILFTMFHICFLLSAITYSATVIPMLLAVPSIMLIAASRLAALRSGIFISAISLT